MEIAMVVCMSTPTAGQPTSQRELKEGVLDQIDVEDAEEI
jgi:hypothetical protein